MITREDDVDAHALHRRGWSISAIARHLGHDRKTIRAYLHEGRVAGRRRRGELDPFEPFVGYCRERLAEDPHVWATTLYDELLELGYDRSYPTFTRQLRVRSLRPACEPCRPARGRPVAVIEHPAGEETQFDWLELPDPPAHWGWGSKAFLLVGALAHSGRWRGVLAESTDQPHVIDGLHRIAAALGGLTRTWRFDRMATVCHPGTGRVTASFAAVAKHYGGVGGGLPGPTRQPQAATASCGSISASEIHSPVDGGFDHEEGPRPDRALGRGATSGGPARLPSSTGLLDPNGFPIHANAAWVQLADDRSARLESRLAPW